MARTAAVYSLPAILIAIAWVRLEEPPAWLDAATPND